MGLQHKELAKVHFLALEEISTGLMSENFLSSSQNLKLG
jgi:hypothetical protein